MTTTKNTGTKNTASTVAVIMPPITPVPIACWLFEAAPVAMASGTTPKMKASEVITIGRNRSVAASIAARTTEVPGFQRSRANSTIRIAFLAERPMIVISPILKYTSLGMPRRYTAATAPMTPSGITSITETGIAQLS